jgi:dienelactone hydrolase
MSRAFLFLTLVLLPCPALAADPLPGTKPLTAEGDLAAQMVAGIDKYLMGELEASVKKRQEFWKPDYSSPEAYTKSVEPNRERLRKILGVVDKRLPVTELEYVSTTTQPALVAETDEYKVYAVRWAVFEGVDGEGLLLEPKGKSVTNVIAIPDAGWTPEMLVGLSTGVPKEAQFARQLAENGCRVIVPVLIDRNDTWSGNPRVGRMTNQPHREFIYRMAFELGRHVIGYEVQKILAIVDWYCRETKHAPVGIYGYGEGGLIALNAAALDPRIRTTAISGYFGEREKVWTEPIYRNIHGSLREFGDRELATMVLPRDLLIEDSKGPEISGPPAPHDGRSGAAPGRATSAEAGREMKLPKQFEKIKQSDGIGLVEVANPEKRAGRGLGLFLIALSRPDALKVIERERKDAVDLRDNFDPAPRQKRQFDQLVNFTQKLLRDSGDRREETFWSKLDKSSLDKYQASTEPFRKQLWEEVIGKLPKPTEPMNPRSRPIYDEPKWKGYEVTLELYPDVFAYGILLLPKDLKEGEKRPVVVCQHGLEGRPTDVCNPKEKSKYYNSFGAQLADKGYIVFAPQNPYIGQDKFRVLQRKANPLGLSLFSFIIRQHECILDWLAEQPCVDPDRMAFYGLSYGGKTAMRVPAVLPRYCLSICAGDFNEWVYKNATVDYKGSYMFSGEYEMPEFNLGHTFNYAEMAALIAPRPFMVERGHDDGVGIDEQVAFEYAKVGRLYSRLKIPDRTAIEFFDGGHEIHGKGTFEFLGKHLKWPDAKSQIPNTKTQTNANPK